MDYYRVLNVSRSATTKEIKQAYLHLAKVLHPDVTGNDETKADLFKHVSHAYSVLSDVTKRREYDATRGSQNFRPHSTGTSHHAFYRPPHTQTGPKYGIDEEVWLAHHYGPHATKHERAPQRHYGHHIVDELKEQEQKRIERLTKYYKLHESAGYFIRREARLRQKEAEERERREESTDTRNGNGCIVA